MGVYSSKESVANYIGVSVDSIADEWIVQVSALIDAWRGDLYPPAAVEVTETLDGTGSRKLFLRHVQIDSITSVTVDGDVIDSAEYYLENGSVVVRTQPYGSYVPLNVWREGFGNVAVVAKTQKFPELLESTTNAIIQYFHARVKLDGLLRVYPRRIREFTEGGGAVTGHDALEETIFKLLQLYLPRPSLVR